MAAERDPVDNPVMWRRHQRGGRAYDWKVKIFLSYAREQSSIAEEINVSLSVRGHDVFFDRSALQPGLEYDHTIQQEIEACGVFTFLISPDAIAAKRYSLTELGFARKRWPNPSGKVLPVMVVPTLLEDVDAWLRAVTILYPQGNAAAEVAAAIDALANPESLARDSQPSTELQGQRIGAYRGLWTLTAVLPKWPRAREVTYDSLKVFSAALRDWYFTDGGGMFLSRPAHTAYAALQDSLTAILVQRPSGAVSEKHYNAVRDLCSALRTRLARDIGARS